VSSTQISVLLCRCWDRCSNRYRPVGYGASRLLSIRKNTLFGKWPALLGNKVSSLGSSQQEVDDEVNSEAADVDSKVADGVHHDP
jgi:hypothetical protein